MAVITISREAGSGGGQIARQLAASLGYHLVDGAFLRPLLEAYGLVEFDRVYDASAGPSAWFADRRGEVTTVLNRLLAAVARHGNTVIVGRGGYAALRHLADVLNVRVQAPLDVRARRLLERGDARDLGAALELAKDNDRRRAAFLKLSYGLEWGSARDFDLVIDTAKLSPEAAAALLARAVEAVSRPGADLPSAAALEVEPVLADTVAEALGCSVSHGPPAPEPAAASPAPL